MKRTALVFSLAFVALGGATAGTLVPINLTTSNVYTGSCTLGSTCPAAVGGVVYPTVSATNVGGTFETALFSSIDLAAPPPAPSSSPQNVTTGSTTTPFILAAQSGSPNNDTFQSANTNNVDTSLTIDLGTCSGLTPTSTCGLFNVDDLYTMIQANGEAFGFQGVTITLNGVTPLGVAVTDTILLTAGIDYRGTTSAQITCTDANATSNASCSGENSDTAQSSGTDSSPGGSGGNTVVTYNNVFGPQTLSAVNYYLDVQELELGSNFLGDYLNSVTITNDSPSGGKERILFSGLTVDDPSTPEPTTVSMLGLGFGLIAFWKIRGRRANGAHQN